MIKKHFRLKERIVSFPKNQSMFRDLYFQPLDLRLQISKLKETLTMRELKKALYKKTLMWLPFLKDAKPNDRFLLENAKGEIISVSIRGFNDKPDEKLGIEIERKEPSHTIVDEFDKATIVPIILHAPRLIFEFNKRNKSIQAFAIYDDRSGHEYAQVKLQIGTDGGFHETGKDLELNEKLDEYIETFIELDFCKK